MHDTSLFLLELLENATRAGAHTVRATFELRRREEALCLTVEDDGRGLAVSPEQALDPFFTSKNAKKTGLGLSLFKAEAEAAGGSLTLDHSPDLGGVRVRIAMRTAHVDRPPVGDLVTTLAVMAAANTQTRFLVTVRDDQAGVELLDSDWEAASAALRALAAAVDGTPGAPQPPAAAGEDKPPRRFATGQKVGPAPIHAADTGIHSGQPAECDDRTRGDALGADLESDDAQSRTKESRMAKTPEDRPCACCCEEASEEELLARLDEVIQEYKEKPGALIPVLQIAQGLFGYLPETALKRIAKGLQKSYSEVAGVVGFYSFFSTVPRGRNVIRVCLGTACYVRGGMAVLESLKKELGIDVGETTEDREFSLEVARCFGACGLAPVITVNDDVHHRVKPRRVNAILEQYAPDVAAAERSA